MTYNKIKEFYEILKTKEMVQAAVKSIAQGFCTEYEILKEYTNYHDGNFYGEEYSYCEDTESYEIDFIYDELDYCCYYHYSEVYYYRNEIRYHHAGNCTERNDIYKYNNEYYHVSSFCYNSLMIDDYNDLINEDDYNNQEDNENYVSSYHSVQRSIENLRVKNAKFFIGYEIEKEDKDVLTSIEIDDFYNECPKWVKEKDGSLDSCTGFELVSPILPLNVKKIREYIKSNDILLNHINADKSNNCGGHINVSEKGKTGFELFDEVKGYTPLFYALYYKRIGRTYSKGKCNEDLKKESSKYQAIAIHNNRIEYRIISAVPNFETLMWRSELINLILKNKESDPCKAYFTVCTKFKNHLRKMYPGDKLNELLKRYENFIIQFENQNFKK